jgi:uncharacterized protein YndB with AHSA1/START domain
MGRSLHIEASVRIDRPPADVWDAIADYSFDREWRKGLSEMTPDPPGGPEVGTRVHEVVRNSGRDYVADTVVTEAAPGTSYRFEGHGTIGRLAGARRVEPSRDGRSVFTYEIELEPQGAMRLLRPVLGSVVRSNLEKDLERLKSLLEAHSKD